MGKTLSALLLCLIMGTKTATIDFTPKPPKEGDQVTITTTGLSAGATLEVQLPPNASITVTVDDDGKAQVKIPSGTEAILVRDEKGLADPVGSPVGQGVTGQRSGRSSKAQPRRPAPKARRAPRSREER